MTHALISRMLLALHVICVSHTGGIGAGLKALSGAAKANVNGVPVDAGVAVTKGRAAIKIKAPVIKAFQFPLQ